MDTKLSDLKIDKSVDARGTACPGPLLEAKRAIEALRAALASDGAVLLDQAERERVEGALSRLEQIAAGDDPDAIKAATEELEGACSFYVERRMNASIRNAMAGHKVEEFE